MAFIGALIYQHDALMPVLREHLDDMDAEVLPHLLMADVIRWLAAHWESDRDLVVSVLEWLEAAYPGADDDVRDVIAISGVEMLPDPGEPGAELRSWLGPRLAALDPWRG